MRLKSELYANEQDETIDKIIQIIGITEENNIIMLHRVGNTQNVRRSARTKP
jgi:hypothetical protein